MSERQSLVKGASTVLNASGAGQVELGPGTGSAANWSVTSIVVQTNRPYVAPIPRVQVYLNEVDPSNSLGVGPDGSFGSFVGEHKLSRGSKLIVTWAGGQAGDIATATANGEQWN